MNILIILGEKLLKNVSMTKNLINRLDKGYELYIKNNYNYIIVCGGIVEKNALISESYIMKKYLVNKNIPLHIIKEEKISTTTIENAKESLKIIKKMDNIKIVSILSSKFHIERVKNIFLKIYNNNYNLKFISSKNGIFGEELKIKKKNEIIYLQDFLCNYK
jgi:uncharacterized SAM-binding protein YcdF (DUF218 family)